MKAVQNITFIRFLFLISYVTFFMSLIFALINSNFLAILSMILCYFSDYFVPDRYAIRYEKHWHVKEPLFFTTISGTTEKKIFIILGIIIFGFLLYFFTFYNELFHVVLLPSFSIK
ncbi:hypothetical protein ACFFIF_07810 [Vagococcus entomophilus]|uniref:Uncharacterized protein n=1 Tax=Vagococcus entomophilus TaxID=1160095 RepID=A0A430AHA5_9ENTE|nr:hypothetical protein [Vagococcus entomophilus]RSU07326.1 hypothetical protein CBF30_08730 [Vagococcus entomophilus]